VPGTLPVGEPVVFTLRLLYTGTDERDAYLRGRDITFDIMVTRDDGAMVWRRLRGAVVPAILHVQTFAPGQSVELRDVWRGCNAPGEYAAVGSILTDGEPLRSRIARFRVTP